MIEGEDVLRDPAQTLSKLCRAIGISYADCMLEWRAGRRATDGVWAPAWYNSVEQSTRFEAPKTDATIELPAELQRIADEARPHYESLVRHKL